MGEDVAVRMAGKAGIGEGDRAYRLLMLNAGEDGALDPEKDDRLEDGCFSLSTGGGGNMEEDAAAAEEKEGVDATDVAGVNGPAVEKRAHSSFSFEGRSITTDSASLAALSLLIMAGRLPARPRPSLTVLGVLACLRPERLPMITFMFVFLPMACASKTPCLLPAELGVEMR